jgi:hypothetical protein
LDYLHHCAGRAAFRSVVSLRTGRNVRLTGTVANEEACMIDRAHRVDHVEALFRKVAIADWILIAVIGIAWLRRGLCGPWVLF